jgi:acetylornithine deacetylase/succinyl-diaminopimelate desuccinylase-like protein
MDVRTYVESGAREFLDDLKRWLAIPSISADPDRAPDVRRSAEWLAAHLLTKEGGSGPEADLADILGKPLVFVGVGLASDRMHAPNERVEVSLLLRGAEASAYLWEELAALGPDAR